MQADLVAFKADLGSNGETITLSVVRKYERRGDTLLYCCLHQTPGGNLWYPTIVSRLGEHRVVNDTGIAQGFFSQQEVEQYIRLGGCTVLPIEVVERASGQMLGIRMCGV